MALVLPRSLHHHHKQDPALIPTAHPAHAPSVNTLTEHRGPIQPQNVGGGEKGYHLAAMAVAGPQAFHLEPFPLDGKAFSERLGTVKGAPLLGAAKRTLAGEDRSGIIKKEGKGPAGTGRSGSQKVAPS